MFKTKNLSQNLYGVFEIKMIHLKILQLKSKLKNQNFLCSFRVLILDMFFKFINGKIQKKKLNF